MVTTELTPVWTPFPGAQSRFLSCPAWECLLHGNRGGGKSQPLHCNVLTKTGLKPMGDIKVGEKLASPHGSNPIHKDHSKVIGVFPQGKLQTYRIIFEGGNSTLCSGDHLWSAYEYYTRGIGPRVYTTYELIKLMDNPFSIYVKVYGDKHRSWDVKKIVSIKKDLEYDCQCIKVDNEQGLYITDDGIVTHNTDVLLMDFLQGVGQGYGSDYKGLLLREATTELGDIITKSKKWIYQIFPDATFHSQKKIWSFPGGETLWLNYARVEDDYWQYHGHEYPWIGWEELTNHTFPTVYLKIMSCNRSANPKIPRKYRATCNPSGPGHSWVKQRFIIQGPPEKIIYDEFGQTRTHIKSELSENKALLAADPMYHAKLMAMTQDNKMLRDAWVLGSWDLITGGFFTDVWNKDVHVLPYFQIPRSWSLFRSFDWGSSKPWVVTYAVETNGEQPNTYGNVQLPYFPKGSVIIINELYGWNGNANEGDRATSQEIAERVLALDNKLQLEYNIKCIPGPADTSIWEVKDGTSIAQNLRTHRCNWTKAYKGSGSRIAGWAIIRQMLGAALRKELEAPHLYFLDAAQHHIRTLPEMQRDKLKPEDIDTEGEDHCMDSLRYFLTRKMMKMTRRKVKH